MPHPSGLGRGLNSLIPSRKPAAAFVTDPKLQEAMETNERISQLPVEYIVPSPHQPRQVFDVEALQGLAESIKEHGVIQPIIVTKKTDGNYEIIAGERRLKASKLAGLKTIPAIIRDLSEQKKMEYALIENLQREDLNALEVAIAYQKLEDEFNLSHADVAKKVGKSVSVIINHLRMLNLRDEVKEAILAGKLTEGHARTLAGLPYEDQLIGMERIIEGKMTVREAEKAAKDVVVRKKIRTVSFDAEARDMEQRLAAALGTKVEVSRHGHTGTVIIKFFSNEELNAFVDKLT
ncbi:MAG: ParB/RepB/Spo0J family partition protein [Candidatus Buchananbacteria bacterium]